VKVIVALAETLGIALLMACTVTEPPAGTISGAVYVVKLGLVWEFRIVPRVAFPLAMPLTSHVTVASCSPVTVAWNDCVPPSDTVAAVGDTATVTTDMTPTEMYVAFEGSARGVAVIWIVPGDGGTFGAVYMPPDEIAPQVAPVHPEPETDHEIVALGFELAAGISVAV
jgi:hypothetical protein